MHDRILKVRAADWEAQRPDRDAQDELILLREDNPRWRQSPFQVGISRLFDELEARQRNRCMNTIDHVKKLEQHEKARQKFLKDFAYSDIVHRLAKGDELNPHAVLAVLRQCDKTADQLDNDVNHSGMIPTIDDLEEKYGIRYEGTKQVFPTCDLEETE